MTNEVENKYVAADSDKATGESKPALNALELLGSAAAAGAASGSHSIGKEMLGQLEITDKKSGSASDSLKEILGSKELLGMKELPLSRTERLLLNGVQDAVGSGNLDKVQDMLKTLAENPGSVDRVLRALNDQMSKDNPLNSARWEQGTDSNGNSFVRLHLNHQDSFSKSSGGTEVTIGSDGRNSSTYRDRWDSPPAYADPARSMRMFGAQKYMDELHQRPMENFNYKQIGDK